MSYYEKTDCPQNELVIKAKSVWKVEVGEAVRRGELICSSTINGTYTAVSGASDVEKILLIVACDAEAGEALGYAEGEFNRDAIILPEGLELETFEPELRKQNISLVKEVKS